MVEDIRRQQRFSSYSKALNKLKDNIEFLKISGHSGLNTRKNNLDLYLVADILKQGLIQSFEFTHELAWKVIQDFAKEQGNLEIRGSKDATRWAAQVNLIEDAHAWMDMLLSRNQASHSYNEDTANEIFLKIIEVYLPILSKFEEKLSSLRHGE